MSALLRTLGFAFIVRKTSPITSCGFALSPTLSLIPAGTAEEALGQRLTRHEELDPGLLHGNRGE